MKSSRFLLKFGVFREFNKMLELNNTILFILLKVTDFVVNVNSVFSFSLRFLIKNRTIKILSFNNV